MALATHVLSVGRSLRDGRTRRGIQYLRAITRQLSSQSSEPNVHDAAFDALGQAAAPLPVSSSAAAVASQKFIHAHNAMGLHQRSGWWAQQALAEEQQKLDELSRALPRGGRVAPQLLDTFIPATPSPSEAALRRLVSSLGADEGLPAVLSLRAAVRTSTVAVGQHTSAGFALERLDRRFFEVLKLWFDSGLMQVQELSADSPPQVRAAAYEVANASSSQLKQGAQETLGPNHRCFLLRHAKMSEDSIPLLVAHVSLTDKHPHTLQEAMQTATQGSQVACIWALGAPASVGTQSIRGLGLGQVLRRGVSELTEASSVTALVPLKGFASWLRNTLAWERPDPLHRALHGFSRKADREVAFVDEDGDKVRFCLDGDRDVEGTVLLAEVGDQPPRRVLKLISADDGRVLRFQLAPSMEALQVNVSHEVASSGLTDKVGYLAEAAGILPARAREPLLRLAYEFITKKSSDGKRCDHPESNFHLAGGAALRALHWRADDSPFALADSLGISASFEYRGKEAESEAAVAYRSAGLDAVIFPTTD